MNAQTHETKKKKKGNERGLNCGGFWGKNHLINNKKAQTKPTTDKEIKETKLFFIQLAKTKFIICDALSNNVSKRIQLI